MSTLLLFLFAVLAPAHAEAPEFLLGDLDVRLDLSHDWHMTRWSDYDFEARIEGDPVLLYAWSTTVRGPVDPPEAWAPVYERKIEDLQGTDPKIGEAQVHEAGGRAFAFVDASFTLAKAGRIVLRGATTEIDGRNFHFAVVAPARLASVASRNREAIAQRLEFTAEVPDPGYGATVEANGETTVLPADWRPLRPDEVSAVASRLTKLGLEDLEDCWSAVRPHPGSEADVMVSCSRGPLHLGVVDELSAGDADQLLRGKLFGQEAGDGTPVPTADRTALLYTPRDGIAFGAIPDGMRVRVVWALGEGDLGDAVTKALAGTTLDVPHAVGVGDQISYYVYHRPLSPVVLCPVGCLCGGVAVLLGGIALVVILRSRRRGDEDDE
ncbi:MAG: hypothetical protein R3F59_22055 [Myxococcota bacterium]